MAAGCAWSPRGERTQPPKSAPRRGQARAIVADMAEEGVPLLINDPEDPRLATRNERAGEGLPITNALLVPLIEHEQNGGGESELGVLEAVNKAGGGSV